MNLAYPRRQQRHLDLANLPFPQKHPQSSPLTRACDPDEPSTPSWRRVQQKTAIMSNQRYTPHDPVKEPHSLSLKVLRHVPPPPTTQAPSHSPSVISS